MSDLEKSREQLIAERDELQTRLGEIQHAEPDRSPMEDSVHLAQFIIDKSAEAAFWLDRDGRYLYANEAACRGLGYTREELLGMTVMDVDPDLDERRWGVHWERIRRRGSMTFEALHRRKNGQTFPVEVTVDHLEFRGRQYHCTFARDITERKRAQEALLKGSEYLQTVIDGIADPILVIGRDYRVVLANRTVRDRFGGEDPVARKMTCHMLSHRLASPCASAGELCPLAQVVATGREVTVTHVHTDSEGQARTYEITGWPIFDAEGQVSQMIEYCRDVTDRVAAERHVTHMNAVLRAIRTVDQTIAQEKDTQRLIEKVCERLVDSGGYASAWIALLAEGGGVERLAAAGLTPGAADSLSALRAQAPPDWLAEALRYPGVRAVLEVPPQRSEWLAELYRGQGALCTRIEADGKVKGLLVAAVPREVVEDPGERDLLSEVAADLGTALRDIEVLAEHRHLMEEELQRSRQREAEIGFRIQQMLLLGHVPSDMPLLQAAAVTVPSQAIDGDFYDFFRHSEHCVDVVIGDVMGKGVPAALLGAATKSHIQRALTRLLIASPPGELPPPRDIVRRVHRKITRQLMDLGSFVTLCYARLDLREGRVDFVNCGHTPVLVYRAGSGSCRTLGGGNLFLGVSEDIDFEQRLTSLEKGDVLLLYSDGVVEARAPSGEMFGQDRLEQLLTRHGGDDPQKILDEILRSLVAFCKDETFRDDVTCLALKRLAAPAEPIGRMELAVASELSELEGLREFVREACARCGPALAESSALGLELAVQEAASNIVRHAYRLQPDREIRVTAEVYPDRLSVCLRHEGESFDPLLAPPTRPDYGGGGGFGLHIIDSAVDDIQAGRDENGPCIRLTQRFAEGRRLEETPWS